MFGDRMQQKDGLSIGLECGHPNVAPGEKCNLCGKVLPATETKIEDTEETVQ